MNSYPNKMIGIICSSVIVRLIYQMLIHFEEQVPDEKIGTITISLSESIRLLNGKQRYFNFK